jgi:hypothetical protein
MRGSVHVTALLTSVFVLGAGAVAQDSKTAARDAAIVKAMQHAMEPGEGQKRLEFLVGTFDVKIRTWVDPSKPPFESMAVSVNKWVLGGRYVQTMLSGFVMGQPFDAIGYAGYDNVAKNYVACYMDSGSTGMEWFTGALDADGKVAKMTATIHDDVTLKPIKVEMRLSIAANGDHITGLWQEDPSGKMINVVELQYTRKK